MKNLRDILPEGQKIDLPVFERYTEPNGFLIREIGCQGLFYYYLHARRTYEENILNHVMVYEGELDSNVNFRQLFESTASLYGITPQELAQYWDCIDRQCMLMNLPLMPNEAKYRFNSVIVLR